MERAVTEIVRLNFIIEAGRKYIVRKRPAHIRPLFQSKTAFCSPQQPKVAQFFLRGDPTPESNSRAAELFARLIEVKHEISV